VQVQGEGGIGVGASIDGVIFVIILGDRDPLGSGELLFQARAAARSHAGASSRVLRAIAMAATKASCSRYAVAAVA
jgi:hypothetical protein